MKKKCRLLFITGSRGEWGYIRPILKRIEQEDVFEYSICATNMHLLPSFGSSLEEIESDGFKVDHKIYMSLDAYNHISQVKSLGIFLSSIADVLASSKPDWIILAGDRGEQLMGAIAGAFCYIPVAHIQAGELSGNIDGMTRHAIGKYAHIHFASNTDAYNRLISLGEEPFRVFNVGAPQVDELEQGYFCSPEELRQRLKIKLDKPFILLAQHPVTEEFDVAETQINATMKALQFIDLPKIIILPNNDAGSLMVRKGIDNHRHGECYVFANLKREEYLGLMNIAACLVGNSSSGLLEAPTFKLPAVNLGGRQKGRLQGQNVINADFNEQSILRAIQQAISDEFRESLSDNCVNPYGDGQTSKRILKILEDTTLTTELVVKNLTY